MKPQSRDVENKQIVTEITEDDEKPNLEITREGKFTDDYNFPPRKMQDFSVPWVDVYIAI